MLIFFFISLFLTLRTCCHDRSWLENNGWHLFYVIFFYQFFFFLHNLHVMIQCWHVCYVNFFYLSFFFTLLTCYELMQIRCWHVCYVNFFIFPFFLNYLHVINWCWHVCYVNFLYHFFFFFDITYMSACIGTLICMLC